MATIHMRPLQASASWAPWMLLVRAYEVKGESCGHLRLTAPGEHGQDSLLLAQLRPWPCGRATSHHHSPSWLEPSWH